MASKQTRIIARVNGEARRLLSITERADGGLIITGGLETHALNEASIPTYPIVEDKVTVHRSGDSLDGGNQIHHTRIYKNRPRLDSYLYTIAIKNGLVAPIYLQVVRDNTNADRVLKINTHDIIEQICEYEPRRYSLNLAVLIGPSGASRNLIQTSSKINVRVVPFSHFTIFVAWCFAFGPAKDSWYHWLTTAPSKVDGASFVGDEPLLPAQGLPPKDARLWLESGLLAVHLRAQIRHFEVLKSFPPESFEVASAMALAGIFNACYDIDDKPLRKLRRQLKAIFEHYDTMGPLQR